MAVIRAFPRKGQMVDGYQYDGPITFDPKYGHLASGRFPAECIRDCSASGSNDDAVEYWVKRLNFTVPRDLAVAYLREYGAWDDLEVDEDEGITEDDLASDETLAERVLWTACHDIRENGDWCGLNH